MRSFQTFSADVSGTILADLVKVLVHPEQGFLDLGDGVGVSAKPFERCAFSADVGSELLEIREVVPVFGSELLELVLNAGAEVAKTKQEPGSDLLFLCHGERLRPNPDGHAQDS